MHCSVRMILFFTPIFALALGAARKILEFSIDHLFGTHLQYGLDDTMHDPISDGAGLLRLPSHGEAIAPAEVHDEPGDAVPAGP